MIANSQLFKYKSVQATFKNDIGDTTFIWRNVCFNPLPI